MYWYIVSVANITILSLPISVGLNIATKIDIIYQNSLCHGKAALYSLLCNKQSWGNSSFILEKKCYATRSHRNMSIANIHCYNHTKMIIVESYKNNKNNHGMNKLETQFETTSHLYEPLIIRSDLDLSWWEHTLNNKNKIKLWVPHGLGC